MLLWKKLKSVFKTKQEKKDEKRSNLAAIKESETPQHIAIVMDGNGRWAKAKGLPRTAGHKAGVDNLKEIIDTSLELGIACLTVYAFSTENWKRPQKEVSYLMGLIDHVFKNELDNFQKKGVKVDMIGYEDRLPDYVKDRVKKTIAETADNQKIKVNIALDYGARFELVETFKKLAEQISNDIIDIEDINQEKISNNLYTAGDPEVDLFIRPGGEKRISNFLLWQIAYSELYFSDTYWPDFGPKEFMKAINEFQTRERRFGGLKKAGNEDA